VAVQTKFHRHTDQGALRRTFGIGYAGVARLALEFRDPGMPAVCIEHVRRQAKELVELQRIAVVEKLGDARRFG
jgi:hypothetical protein